MLCDTKNTRTVLEWIAIILFSGFEDLKARIGNELVIFAFL